MKNLRCVITSNWPRSYCFRSIIRLGITSAILTGLLTASLSAEEVPRYPTPQKITCQAFQPEGRPEVWDVHLVKEFSDHVSIHEFVSEHDSLEKALKVCNKIIQANEKIWKKKGNSK